MNGRNCEATYSPLLVDHHASDVVILVATVTKLPHDAFHFLLELCLVCIKTTGGDLFLPLYCLFVLISRDAGQNQVADSLANARFLAFIFTNSYVTAFEVILEVPLLTGLDVEIVMFKIFALESACVQHTFF